MGILSGTSKKRKYYSLNSIMREKASYNMIIGERSNGKTFSVLERIVKRYLKDCSQGAIIRRWGEDFKGKRGKTLFDSLLSTGVLKDTEWDGIDYVSSTWILYKNDKELNKKIYDNKPLAFAFSLASMEHDKSTSYPDVRTILFDEFLTRGAYLPDEFVLFMNTVSTIIRDRDDVEIFMCANTVNKSAPYFREMGIRHIDKMKQGDIDLYTYGDSELKVAVEYCKNENKESSPSSKYFAFDNPKLKMITGGAWEMAIYPHLPFKYKPKDVKFKYFIKWENDILQCEIITANKQMFTYIHRKTTPIKNEEKDLVFSVESTPYRNYRRRLTVPEDRIGEKIYWFYKTDRVFYQDNEVGEVVRNYLIFSMSNSMIKN